MTNLDSKFVRTTDAWTPELLQEVLYNVRYHRMVYGNGNICIPGNPDWYQRVPFTQANYVWRDKLGNLSDEAWFKLQDMRPEQILHGNPFAPSLLRPGKFRSWDAAVAIPVADIRGDRIRKYDDIVAVRNCNTSWLKHMHPAFQRIGPLGFDRQVLRPKGEYILDLTANKMGWQIIEAAHALGHLRGDMATPRHVLGYAKDQGETAGNFIGFLGEIVFSIMYNLPLDVSHRKNNDPGEPDFAYGIEVKTSSSFADPVLKVPWNNNEALQPDRTLGVVEMAVHIEPHPVAYERRIETVGPKDHWCCLPTIVAVIGWECPDVITHQPLAQHHWKDRVNEQAPTVYAMRPADLMEPGLFWGYLRAARDAMGMPEVGGRWRYFAEWIESPDYKQLLAETPPLICSECMSFVRTDEAPRRPRANVKKDASDYEEQQTRKANVARVHALVNTAIEKYEQHHVYKNRREMTTVRKARKQAHRAKLRQGKKEADFVGLHYTMLHAGQVPPGRNNPIPALTAAGEERYRAFIQDHGLEYTQALLDRADKLGHLSL